MGNIVKLTILGEPQRKQRPQHTIRNGFVHSYTPKKTRDYESVVRYEYQEKYEGIVFDRNEPVCATINAYFGLVNSDFGKKGLSKSGREKMEIGYCTKHIDIDNIIKIILDALNSICYVDDKQIVVINACKFWTLETPRVEIILESLRDTNESGGNKKILSWHWR